MKKTTRIVSLLIALLMLSSFATVFVSADEISAGDILFSEDFEGENYEIVGSTATYPYNDLLSVAEADGNKRLVYNGGGNSGWSGVQLIPASALAGQTKAVYFFDLAFTGDQNGWSNQLFFRLGAEDDIAGNWIRMYQDAYNDVVDVKADSYGSVMGTKRYDAQGVLFSGKNGETVYTAGMHRYAIELDITAKTLNVYVDGEQIITASGDGISSFMGGLWMMTQYDFKLELDNLVVTAGTYADAPALPGDTLFAENFEGDDYQIVGSTATYPYDGKLLIGTLNNNSSLVYNGGGNSSWSGVQLIPASALAGQTKAVYLFDLAFTGDQNGWSNQLFFRLGAEDDIAGNWIRMYQDAYNDVVDVKADSYGSVMGTKRYDAQGVLFSGKNGETVYTADPHRFAIELDIVAKTLNVYVDGEQIIAASGDGISSFMGGLWMMTQYDFRLSIDNLKVVAGSYADVAAADKLPTLDLTPEEEEESVMDQLGWKVDADFATQDQELNISGKLGDDGNKSLKVVSSTDAWCGMEIVPAEAMAGVTKYVLRFSMSWTSATRLTFRMNEPAADDAAAKSGDWVGVSYFSQIEHTEYDVAGERDEQITFDIVQNEGFNHFAVEVDLVAGTMKTYYNDMTTPVNTRSITYDTASAIYFIARGCDGYVDDISVVKGDITTVPDATNTIYSEDFQSYETTIDETTTVQELLGWSTDPNYPATGHKLDISNAKGENNKTLKLSEKNDAWCGMEIVPAEAMAGVTKYVLKVNVIYSAAVRLTFRMNRPADATADAAGNWTGLNWTNRIEHTDYDAAGVGEESLTFDIAPLANEAFNTLAIAVDLENKTINTYWNDMATPMNTRTIAQDTASAIWMVLRSCEAYIDNLIVYKGDMTTTPDAANTIYAEDFESYDVTDEAKPTRPATDYTGKEKGEIILKEDYNNATNVDELYYVPTANANFKAATVELSPDAVNGTNCAKITGTWALVEIIPLEVIESYDVYTLQMKVRIDSNTSRFNIFYNTSDPASTENCGWFEMRYNTLEFFNDARTNGVSTAKTTPSAIECGGPDSIFDLALTVDCVAGTCYAYLNGKPLNFAAGVNTTKSAIYMVVEGAVGYLDDVTVSNGTYAEYLAFNGLPPMDVPGGDGNTGDGNGDSNVTEAPIVTDAPTNQAPVTEAPAEEKKGCKGSVAITAVLAMVAIGSCGLVVKRKND